MSQLLAQLLKVVVVLGDDVLGDGLVAAVGLVHEDALLEEPAEQRAQQLGGSQTAAQLAQERTDTTFTIYTGHSKQS